MDSQFTIIKPLRSQKIKNEERTEFIIHHSQFTIIKPLRSKIKKINFNTLKINIHDNNNPRQNEESINNSSTKKQQLYSNLLSLPFDYYSNKIPKMKQYYLVVFLLPLISLFSIHSLQAQQIIFPNHDTFVADDAPDSNKGSSQILRLRQSTSGATTARTPYLSFDLSSLQELQGQIILEVHRTNNVSNNDIRLEAFVDPSFDENIATWNNQPTEIKSLPYGRQVGSIIQFDITTWANYMIGAGEPLQVRLYTNTASNVVKLASKNHVDTAKRPKLKCYTTPTVNLTLVPMASSVNSNLVSLNNDGSLSYTADGRGNTLIDHGMVGYHQGLRPIPNVPVVRTLTPSSGDRTADIQAAIDAIEAMPLNANGHRGALLLKAGYYEVTDTLEINASGVVIRGEGNGTDGSVIRHVAPEQHAVIQFAASASVQVVANTQKNITDSYVPTGAKSITVEGNHNFQAGDAILVTRAPNQDWINLLGMDNLAGECGEGHSNWTPASYTISTKHNIVRVDGNILYMDTPIVDPIDPVYASGYVQKYTWIGLEECGVENMRFESKANFDNDENHAKRAIEAVHVRNAWFRKINSKDFMNNCVKLDNCYQVTIDECEIEDYKSKITGGRRYGFGLNKSQLILVKNCKAHDGRHDYALGSRTPGPNVFVNCTSTNAHSDNGPHHRWGTGCLWDNVVTDNKTNLQLRKCSGSGHGWAASQNILWNCVADEMAVHNPPADHQNWAIGCTGNVTNRGYSTAPLGYVESTNTPIGFSLYLRQAMEFQKRQRSTSDCSNTQENFETGLGIWNDGGVDCQRGTFTGYSNSGAYSIRLRDNSGQSSSIYSNPLDLSNAQSVTLHFSYMAHSMDWKEDFLLEISTDGGSSFTTFRQWILNDDFVNNTRYNEVLDIPGQYFSATTVFRIRCDASGDYDFVYVDDLRLETCTQSTAGFRLDNQELESFIPPISLYPNPVNDILQIDLTNYLGEKIKYAVYNTQGNIVAEGMYDEYHQRTISVDLNTLPNGNYIIAVQPETQAKIAKQFVILR